MKIRIAFGTIKANSFLGRMCHRDTWILRWRKDSIGKYIRIGPLLIEYAFREDG